MTTVASGLLAAIGTAPGVTGAALRSAVQGLAARSRATADNIANLQTPGFIANRVTFEDELSRAVGDRSRSITGSQLQRSLEPVRQDGNNVNLDQETLTSLDTGMRYQLMLRAIDDRFQNLRTAMRTMG